MQSVCFLQAKTNSASTNAEQIGAMLLPSLMEHRSGAGGTCAGQGARIFVRKGKAASLKVEHEGKDAHEEHGVYPLQFGCR